MQRVVSKENAIREHMARPASPSPSDEHCWRTAAAQSRRRHNALHYPAVINEKIVICDYKKLKSKEWQSV